MTAKPVTSATPSMWFEDDLVVVRVVGEVGVTEMQRMIEMSDQLLARHGYIMLLADAQRATGLHPDARKLQAQRTKQVLGPSHVAIYHVNRITRTIATLMQRGIELVTSKSYPISFHRDEAEARGMLTSQRPILRARAARQEK